MTRHIHKTFTGLSAALASISILLTINIYSVNPQPVTFRAAPGGQVITNRLLLSLSDAAFNLFERQLEHATVPTGTVLKDGEQFPERSWFPDSGVVSLVVTTERGASAQVGLVGNEGMTNASFAVGLRRTLLTEVVQHPVTGWNIDFNALQKLLQSSTEIQRVLSRYLMVQTTHIAQIAACNRLHTAEERMARWLLMTADRAKSNFVIATQDWLTSLLGVARQSVSRVARSLQRERAIRYRRSRIEILDRGRLERAACECYRTLSEWDLE